MLFAEYVSISLLNSGSQLDPAQLNPSLSDVFLKLKGNIIATKKLQSSEHKKLKGTKCPQKSMKMRFNLIDLTFKPLFLDASWPLLVSMGVLCKQCKYPICSAS